MKNLQQTSFLFAVSKAFQPPTFKEVFTKEVTLIITFVFRLIFSSHLFFNFRDSRKGFVGE